MMTRFAFLPKHIPLGDSEILEIKEFIEGNNHQWLNMIEYQNNFVYFPSGNTPRPYLEKEARIYFEFNEYNSEGLTWKTFSEKLGYFLVQKGHTVPWVKREGKLKSLKLGFIT